MNNIITTVKNIWNIKELRDKLILTFGLILVYRFATYISLPAINMFEVGNILDKYKDAGGNDQTSGLLGLLSSFTGGAFSRASIMALGVMPYISASIVIQLAGLAVPYFKKLQNEGESGRKTINQITRWLTIAICLFQAPTYLIGLTQGLIPVSEMGSAYLIHPDYQWFWFYVPSVIILTSGTLFTMWLGERITENGIGNGISILIMVGILADFPNSVIMEFQGQSKMILFVLEIIFWLFVLLLSIVLVTAVRKVPVQYVSHIQKGGVNTAKSSLNAVRNFIPLKVNAAGVMPIIFAQALMFVPGLLGKTNDGETPTAFQHFMSGFSDMFSLQHNVLFAIMIIIFTYFYTAISIPVNQMADDLKRNGGLIPKVKPGIETANFLDDILSKITLPGAIFLAFIAIMPAIVHLIGLTETQNFARFFGGTSLIIMVGVILDTVQQINTYLLNHHYDGLMSSKLSRNLTN